MTFEKVNDTTMKKILTTEELYPMSQIIQSISNYDAKIAQLESEKKVWVNLKTEAEKLGIQEE